MTANESLRDSFISHAVYFERYKTHEVNQLFRVLDEANRAAKAVVLKTDGAATKARYQAIMKEIASISAQARETMDKQLRLDLVDLIGSENEFIQKAVGSAIGVNLELILPAPKQVFTAATFMPFSESATFETMLNDIDSNLYSTWDMSIRTGYLTGETAQSINRRVLGSVSGLQVGTMAKLKRGLEANTRTMIAHYAEQTRNAIYRENNDLFQGYQRLETLDTKTCLVCGAEDGKVYKSLDLAPSLPAHLNCVLGDTFVSSGTDISAVSKRIYDGDIFIIRTSSGNSISVTPNHPILTDRGFVVAKDLYLGQNLVCDDGINRVGLTGKNDNNVKSSIEELFHTFIQSREMSTKHVPTTSKDFHGDGTDEEIAIIACNRELPDMQNTSFVKKFLQRILVCRTHTCAIIKPCDSPVMKFFLGLFSSPCSVMSSLSKMLDLVRRCALHTLGLLFAWISHNNSSFSESIQDIHSRNTKPFSDPAYSNAGVINFKHSIKGRPISGAFPQENLKTSFEKSCIDSFSIDPILACNLINGKAGLVKLDQVIDIRKNHFTGHVYNLQTKGSWFIANGIITHNCRGLYVPVLKNWQGLGITERASVDGVVPGDTDYSKWFDTQSADRQEDILGPSRYELYKTGEYKIKDFAPDGRTLTLAQLREK